MVELVLKSEHAAANDTDAVESVILIILWRISYKIDIRRHATFVGSYIRSTLKIAMVLIAVIIDMISASRVEMADFVDHDLMLQRGLPSAFVPVATHVAAPNGLGLGLGLAHFVRVPPR
jgi:hypothetical protein